jgi:hypothetical protein
MEKDTFTLSSTPPPLRISEEARLIIRDFLRQKFRGDGDGCYFFRRFNKLNNSSAHPISITRNFGPDVYETLNNLEGLDEDTIKKSIDIKYNWFSGFTDSRQIRDEHEALLNKDIYIHSNDYAQIDMSLNYTFKLSNVKQLNSHITPQQDDLLFLYVSNSSLQSILRNTTSQQNGTVLNTNAPPKKHLKPRADMWCIVSEQFLRAWTLVCYDWHDSFNKIIPINTPVECREDALRQKLFIGNKLMTNSWLKRKLALQANGKSMSVTESREKYWHLRTEYVSRKWVDVYAAIVLISRYGELPCPVNVPNNQVNDSNKTGFSQKNNIHKVSSDELVCITNNTNDNVETDSKSEAPCLHNTSNGGGRENDALHYIRTTWSLPDVFVTMLLHKCSVGINITEHLINYNVWRDYSKSSMLFSIHGHNKNRGFFDDIHQHTYNLTNTVCYAGDTMYKLNNQPVPFCLNKTPRFLFADGQTGQPDYTNSHFGHIGDEPESTEETTVCDTINTSWATIVKIGSKSVCQEK